MIDRRTFLARGALLTAGLSLGCAPRAVMIAPGAQLPGGTDSSIRELAMRALDAARSAGASYADVRINRNRTQSVATRERRITGLEDDETMGFGIRVLVDGTWGFAASRELNLQEVDRVARRAADQARANRGAQRRRVELAPVEVYPDASWRSPIEIDPFDVPIEEKVSLLLAANEAALDVDGARFVTSSMAFVREEKTFASTEGTFTTQTVYRSWPRMSIRR